MVKKCFTCRLVNFPDAEMCTRCGGALAVSHSRRSLVAVIARRASTCAVVCIILLAGFYLSLIASAEKLPYSKKQAVRSVIAILDEKGFTGDAFLLGNLTAFRTSDNWLNASVAKENAFAATNFPFEIVTIYDDFFTYPADDIERAAILLHEAQHLAGKDEHDAYEFVWKNRAKLGWTSAKYGRSPVWQNVRKQTRDNVPEIFNCPDRDFSDCTETAIGEIR